MEHYGKTERLFSIKTNSEYYQKNFVKLRKKQSCFNEKKIFNKFSEA